MSKEILIKSFDNFHIMPIYLTIDDIYKTKNLYTTCCTLRNQLIENNIIDKSFRHYMIFYKKIKDNFIKIKEGDILDVQTIYLKINEEIDYSEPINIMYHLEERIANFEKEFSEFYRKDYINYSEIKKIWKKFREENNDCIDYAEWYFVIKPNKNDIILLNKIALDIKKWVSNKEKIIYELDINYLNTISYTVKDEDFNFIEKFLENI